MCQAGGKAQQPPPTFRGGVELVQLDVVVLDKNRHPVTGLRANDFSVLEDGTPRPLTTFSAVTLPDAGASGAAGAAAWTRDVAPDVTTNRHSKEGRLVVIMMDRSIPMEQGTVAARAIAKSAVDALGPDDLAAVVYNSGFATEGAAQNFSADHELLRAAVDAPFAGLVNPPEMTPRGLVRGTPDLLHTGDCLCGVCVLDAIARTAQAMGAEETRQKMILWVGSGIVIQERPDADCDGRVRAYRERAMHALDRANVTFHALDPTGLETLARNAEAFPYDQRRLPGRTLERQGDLAVFSSYTGGRTVLNTNHPEDAVPEIFDETRSYYLLAFPRDAAPDDGRRHKIEVKVNRRGVTVRTRSGYYAPAPASATVEAANLADRAAGELLPETDIPMRLAATPAFEPDGSTGVAVLFGVDRLSVPITGTAPSTPTSVVHAGGATLDVVLGVFDPRARPVASQRITIDLPDGLVPDDAHPFERLEHVPLAPGRYEVRVGVTAAGQSGSVYGYVEVPDPSKDRLAMSGVTIEARPPAPPAADGAPIEPQPTLRRVFAADEPVLARVQLHRAVGQSGMVTLATTVTDAHDRAVATGQTTLDAARFDAAGLAGDRITVPTSGLAPGAYLLTVDASGGESSAQHKVRFEIR